MSNYEEHAKREFLKLGYKPIEECEDDPDKWVQENILELLEVLSKQGHSGSSASYVISMFSKLAKFEPLSPITCEDDEWDDLLGFGDYETYQNKRLSSVFKKGKNGKPYYINAIVWRDQEGSTFTGSVLNSRLEKITSKQNIKIPFMPKTFYIDVVDTETSPGDFEHIIKDETQLKKVWNYYEHQETLSYIRYKKLKEIENAGYK